jgi:DNA polymerase elongation subunit (family B)
MKPERWYKTKPETEPISLYREIDVSNLDVFENLPKGINFYDFEVFRFDWTVTIINSSTQIKTIIANNINKLKYYYQEHKDELFCGYNSRNYDKYIFKTLLLGGNPKLTNDLIIIEGLKGWQIDDDFRNIPLLDFDIKTVQQYSLKQLEAFLGHDIRETQVSFLTENVLTKKELLETLKYNGHDVLETIHVFKNRIDYFNSHRFLIDKFNLSESCISKTQAQLASVILECSNENVVDDEWAIRVPKNLRISKYSKVVDWFLDKKNHKYKCGKDSKERVQLITDIAGMECKFGWGGLHGALDNFNYTCKEDEILLMSDVSQLYPNLMYWYELLPRTVSQKGYSILKSTIDISIELKEKGLKEQRKPYKDFNNIIYGSMGDKFNKLYDPLHRNLVCVFGQLLILDLIEKTEHLGKYVQVNTDGILILIKKDNIEMFKKILHLWEKRTKLVMTFDEYTNLYQANVNNYVIYSENDVKNVGGYLKKRSKLDNNLSIVRDAIFNKLVKNIDVSETICSCNELIKFQHIVKLSSDYNYVRHNGNVYTDKTYRIFASTDFADSGIGRYRAENDIAEKFADTPNHCFILNDNIENKACLDKLDKSWYINLANDRLAKIFNVSNINSFF